MTNAAGADFFQPKQFMRYGSDLVLGLAGIRPIVLRTAERLKHLHITGLTGTGKSRYLESLIRQDLRAWPWTKCGMLVVDPHGEVVSGIMDWVAANRLTHLPIVPIDFRRQDQIISYNVLRQRASEPSVIIDNFVKAMAYVWGQGGTDQTPLFERWSSNVLRALYHAKRTLSDAVHLFTPEGLVIANKIDDPMIRRDFLWARRNYKDFEIATSSSVNRFRRFLLNPTLRAMFGQTDRSLDLGQALDEGQIVLVSLARNGGNISRENADLFSTLLLADLWAAADERGKSDDVKPFWVYVDEFQRFLFPSMAEGMAEARGFGLGMVLSNQHPQQILTGGVYGERIYNEVMENTRSKVVLRLRTRANLQPVAESLFMDTFDPDQVKHQHYSTKVMGHELHYMQSTSSSHVRSDGGGTQESHTTGRNHTVTASRSTTRSEAHTLGTSASRTRGTTYGASVGSGETDTEGASENAGWNHSASEGHAAGRNWSTTNNAAAGGSIQVSRAVSAQYDLGRPSEDLKDDLRDADWERPDYHQFVDDSGDTENDLDRDRVVRRVGVSDTRSAGIGATWSQGESATAGGNTVDSHGESYGESGQSGRSASHAHNHNRQLSVSGSLSDTVGTNESMTEGLAETEGESETDGTSEGETLGTNTTWSDTRGTSVTVSPMLIPQLGQEADAPIYRPIDEQIFIAMLKIAKLKDREAWVLTAGMSEPVFIRTPEIRRSNLSRLCTHACIGWYQVESGLALPLTVALETVLARDAEFLFQGDEDAVESPRRRIKAAVRSVDPRNGQ